MLSLPILLFVFLLIFILFRKISFLEKELAALKQKSFQTLGGEREENNMSDQPLTTDSSIENVQTLSAKEITRSTIPPQPDEAESTVVSYRDREGAIHQHTTSDSLISKLSNKIKNYFTQGNILVRIGGVLLFFGLAFLLKYAAQHSSISMEVRLAGVAVTAVVLLLIGWRLRLREGSYGVILQGVGIALLYLVIFVAAKYYALLSLELAFGLMFAVVVFGSLIAVIQNALPLALFSLTGGFMAPILTSDGTGSHLVLFGYYALLDMGIVAIAWYRSWRSLNLVGFFFTFVIATAWGVLRYEPALLNSTEPFLILFFLIYLFVSILFTLKQPFYPRGFIDATLVFGLPLVAFSLQISLIHEVAYGVAYSAMVVGSLYFLLFKILSAFKKMRLLSEAFLALGVVFYTIAVPYTFDDQFTGALWVLEGAAIIWIALRQQRPYARLFGELLQAMAILLYLFSSGFAPEKSTEAFLNPVFLGYCIITAATLLSAYLLHRDKVALSRWDRQAPMIFLLMGMAVWLMAGALETHKLAVEQANAMLIYIALSVLPLSLIAFRLRWSDLILLLQFYLPLGALLIISLRHHYLMTHPFEGIGLPVLLLFFAMHYFLLYRFDKEWSWHTLLHLAGLWLMVLIGVREMQYAVSLLTENKTWQDAGVAFLPVTLSLVMLRWKHFLPKIFAKYQSFYRLYGVSGLLLGLYIWEIQSFSLAGDPAPWAYIPLLNPLDLMQVAGVATMFYWIHVYRDRFDKRSHALLLAVGSVAALVLSSVIYARSVHFYAEIAYMLPALFESLIFQTGLSILWTLISMLSMMIAKRLHSRIIWIGGFGLLMLVVVKLFFVELSGSGTVERIISFVVVGAMLLLIGYFAPIPPRVEEEGDMGK